jgi:hypothetical protein
VARFHRSARRHEYLRREAHYRRETKEGTRTEWGNGCIDRRTITSPKGAIFYILEIVASSRDMSDENGGRNRFVLSGSVSS